jgi:UDP-2,3-diacylglucosamine pyrophosphatase LpxH
VDAVLCGHIHKAELGYVDDILYCNTGDWVESCTAMVENQEGVSSTGQMSILSCAGKPSCYDQSRLRAMFS